jgi:hypothetical protein
VGVKRRENGQSSTTQLSLLFPLPLPSLSLSPS